MNIPKKILFLTTHNLATNPRLVKEIKLALENGYGVEVICFEFNNWSREPNEQLKNKFSGIKIHTINAGRKPMLPWLLSVLTETGSRFLGKIFPLPIAALSQGVSRRSNGLIKALRNIESADWVIGHNPGALYPTLMASKKLKCKAGFDVEDYHPGEGNNSYMQDLTRKLIQQVLPQMDYVSFAAPLIKQAVEKDCKMPKDNWFTVLNYFPSEEFKEPGTALDGPVKLVWFSQNISVGRGLELIIPFVKQSNDTVELHLIGNLDSNFYSSYLKGISNIIIHVPLSQKGLHLSLSQYDIGLALEPAKDRNNELAVSNKMLAYLQAGLYIVATNTPAQQALLNEVPAHGICFDYKTNTPEIAVKNIIAGIASIRMGRIFRYHNFKERNWEAASLSLREAWMVDDPAGMPAA